MPNRNGSGIANRLPRWCRSRAEAGRGVADLQTGATVLSGDPWPASPCRRHIAFGSALGGTSAQTHFGHIRTEDAVQQRESQSDGQIAKPRVCRDSVAMNGSSADCAPGPDLHGKEGVIGSSPIVGFRFRLLSEFPRSTGSPQDCSGSKSCMSVRRSPSRKNSTATSASRLVSLRNALTRRPVACSMAVGSRSRRSSSCSASRAGG